MPASNNDKVKLAVGLFSGPGEVGRAIDELARSGVPCWRLSLVTVRSDDAEASSPAEGPKDGGDDDTSEVARAKGARAAIDPGVCCPLRPDPERNAASHLRAAPPTIPPQPPEATPSSRRGPMIEGPVAGCGRALDEREHPLPGAIPAGRRAGGGQNSTPSRLPAGHLHHIECTISAATAGWVASLLHVFDAPAPVVALDAMLGGLDEDPDLEEAESGLERQLAMLQQHIRRGRPMLIVKLADEREQHRVCTTLLAHASRGVQTHDIRARG